MNNEFKKGFLEAIDGVLDIINESGQELDKENKAFKYELKKLENSVLGLKVSFFESYYEPKGLEDIYTPEEIRKAMAESERRFNESSRQKEEDEPGKEADEDIRKYCEEKGLDLEEYKAKMKKLALSMPNLNKNWPEKGRGLTEGEAMEEEDVSSEHKLSDFMQDIEEIKKDYGIK